jgi:four helix bundle protein
VQYNDCVRKTAPSRGEGNLSHLAAMGDFKDLKVWQRSRELMRLVYRIADELPQPRLVEIAAQIRASALSIPSNIAEGNGRHSDRDQARHYRIAIGSVRELEAQLILLNDLEMLSTADWTKLSADMEEVGKMRSGLLRYCARRAKPKPTPRPSPRTSRLRPRA